MYNKLFTKILDSSIWLESDATRIVWMTFLAAMDDDGFVAFASPANVAHRARVSLEAAEAAIAVLEAPDANSSDPENEGRRAERCPGGWYVLNANKYRELVTRLESKRLHRDRQQRYREGRKVTPRDAVVTHGDVRVTPRDVRVTQSDTDTEADTDTKAGSSVGVAGIVATQSVRTISHPRQAYAAPLTQSAKAHASHGWCSGALPCVVQSQHDDFLKRIGGEPSTRLDRLKAWYLGIEAEFRNQTIGDETFTFWRNLFARDFGTVTTAPSHGRDSVGAHASKLMAKLDRDRGQNRPERPTRGELTSGGL